jgi:hypothetical protein
MFTYLSTTFAKERRPIVFGIDGLSIREAVESCKQLVPTPYDTAINAARRGHTAILHHAAEFRHGQAKIGGGLWCAKPDLGQYEGASGYTTSP